MANTLSAVIQQVLTVTETLNPTAGDIGPGVGNVIHNGFNQNIGPLTSLTTPDALQCAYFNKALSGGAATVDLTSLTGTNGAAVNGNTQKVIAAIIAAPVANGAKITVKNGASNGHPCFGTAFTFDLLPGQSVVFYLAAGDSAIGGSSKNIDLAGTGTDSLNIGILLG